MPVGGTRRGKLAQSDGHRFGLWRFTPATGAILVNGTLVARLTETEAETLDLLIRAYPLALSRQALINEMRRVECYYSIETVKVVIRRLRRKLGRRIVLTHAWGYRFDPA